MQIVYQDRAVAVVLKPAGVVSTDVPGGLPELVRQQLGWDNIRTVHRLDQVVSGLTVLAKTARAASDLSRQIREDRFGKKYLAVVHGTPEESGTLEDLLLRDKKERKTYVVPSPGKDVQQAVLRYKVLDQKENMSLVEIQLVTGRTHQIRCQFASRGYPLVGDKKYGLGEDCDTALWSAELTFSHPYTGVALAFSAPTPAQWPWSVFRQEEKENL